MTDTTQLTDESLLTEQIVANLLHVSARTLSNWRCGRGSGQTLRFIRIGPRRVLYKWSDVRDFIKRMTIER